MSKYSSLLFQPEQYHEIGPFRFPVYNDLVPREARGIEQLTRSTSQNTFKSIRVAKQIAQKKGITTKEAIQLLSEIGQGGDTEEMVYEYAQELEELGSAQQSEVELQISFVTLFMRYRGEVQMNGKKSKWQKLEDWETSDTESMPTKLMTEVYNMILWERDGWPEPGKSESDSEK